MIETQGCVDCDKEVYVDSHSTVYDKVDGDFEHHKCENGDKEKLLKQQEALYCNLTATFNDKKQFTLLNALLEVERELEKECNQ
jgi:hypothetical protein